MLDVAYFVRPGDDNEELRYSLRSVAANLPHAHLLIAGHRPYWARTAHLPVEQSGSKYGNAQANIRAILACDELTDTIAILNDDHMVTAPIDTVPVLHCGPLAAVRAVTSALYQRSLDDTLHLLRGMGFRHPNCYDLHVPYVANRQALTATLDCIAQRTEHWPAERTARVLWETVHATLNGYTGDYSPDVKIRDGLRRDTWPTPFMSTEDSTYWGPAGRHLRQLFPTPCRYERPA